MSKLTAKEARFIDEYIICLNGTEACRRAMYEGDDNVLAVTAHRMLRKPKIKEAIEARLAEHAMGANELLVHLSDIVRGDLADCLTSTGTIDPLEAKKRGKSHLIKRYKHKRKTITTTDKNGDNGSDILEDEYEVELYSRLEAMNMLAKYHQLLTTRIQIDDWRSQAIADIRAGVIPVEAYGELAAQFGTSLAAELFAAAGVQISVGDDTP